MIICSESGILPSTRYGPFFVTFIRQFFGSAFLFWSAIFEVFSWFLLNVSVIEISAIRLK